MKKPKQLPKQPRPIDLPEPILDQLGREHLLALVQRHFFPVSQREIASVVWEVESAKARRRMEAALERSRKAAEQMHATDAQDTAARLAAMQAYLDSTAAWERAAAYDDQVQLYYERWLMGPVDPP